MDKRSETASFDFTVGVVQEQELNKLGNAQMYSESFLIFLPTVLSLKIGRGTNRITPQIIIFLDFLYNHLKQNKTCTAANS